MEGRRPRRFGRGRQANQNLLPVRFTRLSNTVSCWYCDFKSTVLNEPLFRFGRRHSRFLRIWFSVGVGFGLAALLGGIMILLWELGRAVHLYEGKTQLGGLLNGSLFGFSSTISGLNISFSDTGYMCISTILSVLVHEVGHALAAASEGVQMEYVAVFLAAAFPGAMVALNYELLQILPRFATLRIYCAGVWHNAAFCMLCALALFFLPLMLDPFYIHGESPMVLDVSPTSPLTGYLSPHDLIISLGGKRVHTVQEWKETIALLNEQILKNFESSANLNYTMPIIDRKGYCVPNYLMKESVTARMEGNETTCTDELYAFASTPCLGLRNLEDVRNEVLHRHGRGGIYCLNPKDVIKLVKCGDGWDEARTKSNNCSCLEDESCFSPVQMPGLAWVEIIYLSPAEECLRLARSSSQEYNSADVKDKSCVQSFVFVGDMISMGRSLRLTSYLPRWEFYIGAHLPDALEKHLLYAFHVSLTIALLNSLPVYFLDGESILETVVQYFSFLLPSARGLILQLFLLGGTFISVVILLQSFFLLLRRFTLWNGGSISNV